MASEAALEGSITQPIMADEGMLPRSNWKLVGRCARLDSRALVAAEVLFMLLLFGLHLCFHHENFHCSSPCGD